MTELATGLALAHASLRHHQSLHDTTNHSLDALFLGQVNDSWPLTDWQSVCLSIPANILQLTSLPTNHYLDALLLGQHELSGQLNFLNSSLARVAEETLATAAQALQEAVAVVTQQVTHDFEPPVCGRDS